MPDQVAKRLKALGGMLGTTECLIRYQVPMLDPGAMRDTLHGLGEVIGLVA